MAVLDASFLITALLDRDAREGLILRRVGGSETLHAPELVDLEIHQALRRILRQGIASLAECERGLANLALLRLSRHSHADLLKRVWALRDSMSAYDATYVALAERLGMRMLTGDLRLANAHGSRAVIEFVG